MKGYDENVAGAIASVDVKTSYDEFATLDDGIQRVPVTDTLTVDFWHGTDWDARIKALSSMFLGKADERDDRPTEVIFHGPAVVTYFADGRRTVATCKPDDRYRHRMGELICALKRVCGKRDRVDEWEDTLAAVSRLSRDEMRTLSKALSVAADIADVVSTEALWNCVVDDLEGTNPRIAKALRGSKVTDDGDMVTVRMRRVIDKPHGRAVARAVRRHFGHRNVMFDCEAR